MNCPICGGKSRVFDSRTVPSNPSITRRTRVCRVCDFRFGTHEEIVWADAMKVRSVWTQRSDVECQA